MAEVLELAQLLQHDGVAEVDVGRGRVEPELDAQLAALARGGLQLAPRRPPAGSDSAALRARKAASSAGGSHRGPMLVLAAVATPAPPVATTPQRPRDAALAPRRMSDEYGSNITPLFGDHEPPEPPPAARPRVKKRRLLAILLPLGLLAIVSTVFGMMMAVASDLPDLENRKEYQDARNSVLVRRPGQARSGVLTNNQSRVLVALRATSRRTCATRSSRSRTAASTRTRASTCAASAARSSQDVLSRKRGAGRLDDHPAVRQERAARAVPTARSSRSCARRRSPTTSRASGPRARSSPST